MDDEKRTSVLVVEDDIHYGQLLAEALQAFHYTTYLTFSATGGLDIIRKHRLNIVLSDVNMPGINGIELAKNIMKMYLDIPVVLITGINDLSLVKEALEIGVSDYLVKPVGNNSCESNRCRVDIRLLKGDCMICCRMLNKECGR